MATAGTRSAGGKKKRRGNVSFTAKDGKGMTENLKVIDYEDVVERLIENRPSPGEVRQ